MVKIKDVHWINLAAEEAIVTLTDGKTTLLCFSQPFRMNIGEELTDLVYTFNAKNIMKSNLNDLMVRKQDDTFAYFLRAKFIDLANKTVKLGGFRIVLENCSIPGDLVEGDTIEFQVERLDIY